MALLSGKKMNRINSLIIVFVSVKFCSNLSANVLKVTKYPPQLVTQCLGWDLGAFDLTIIPEAWLLLTAPSGESLGCANKWYYSFLKD